MKIVYVFLISFILIGCSSTKKVYVCGDHICVNKEEAKQYFDENLTLEIRVVTKNKVKKYDLVQLNTNVVPNKKKKNINLFKIKTLNDQEEKKQKLIIKEKKKLAKLNTKKKDLKERELNVKKKKNFFEFLNKKEKKVVKKKISVKQTVYKKDICQIIDKCEIDDISNYLIKVGKKKGYPDLTLND